MYGHSGAKTEYMKDKINVLETNRQNINSRNCYRIINKFKKGYKPRANLVKDENGDLHKD